MFTTIILIIFCIVLFFFAICAFFMAHEEKEERYKLETELNEVREHERKEAAIITEANKTKADARTGDHSADIKYMANKLHNYANK